MTVPAQKSPSRESGRPMPRRRRTGRRLLATAAVLLLVGLTAWATLVATQAGRYPWDDTTLLPTSSRTPPPVRDRIR